MFNHHLLPFRRAFTTSVAATNLNVHQNFTFLLTKGNLNEALTLFYTSNLPHTQQTYADFFHACARHGRLSQGQHLHHHMLKTHNQNHILPNLYVSNHLINMYAKCGFLEHARKLFDEMPDRNIVSWTALISGYAQSDRRNESCGMFCEMLANHRPNEFAYASVLSCCNLVFGRQIHSHTIKTCFDTYTYVANALITMYSKNDDANEAWVVFKFLISRNLVTYNSMISGFQIIGKWEEAINLFSLMRQDSKIGFDRATLLSILSSLLILVKDCGNYSNSHVITSCHKYCSQLHSLAIKTWFITEIEVITALAKAYANLDAEITDLYNLFMETSGMRDIVSWTAFMTIFADQKPEESILMFSRLCEEGFNPDSHTYSIVLKACAGLVTDRHTLAIHTQIVKHGFENDTVLANALIHAYGRSGSVHGSEKVFDFMIVKDIVSWNSMIKIYGLHGQSRNALNTFDQMLVKDIVPDSTTFVAVLSACSHTGLVEKGTEIFENMHKIYGIEPQLDHYACMVDILARSGRISHAQKLINEMPMKPDSVIWSVMLGACRKHGEKNLAKLSAEKLRELDPNNSLGYVLMSNIMCTNGSFNEAIDIRKQMKGLGVKKDPGLSWTEIGTRVHEFGAGGLLHPQRETILVELEELVKKLKGLGYVEESNLVMRDVEEEDKNRELSYHSEKLAFVFALMCDDESKHVIRIVKNIRICVDCHNFMKFASELTGREIVVRDSNRFHHFKQRVCSCDDYW